MHFAPSNPVAMKASELSMPPSVPGTTAAFTALGVFRSFLGNQIPLESPKSGDEALQPENPLESSAKGTPASLLKAPESEYVTGPKTVSAPARELGSSKALHAQAAQTLSSTQHLVETPTASAGDIEPSARPDNTAIPETPTPVSSSDSFATEPAVVASDPGGAPASETEATRRQFPAIPVTADRRVGDAEPNEPAASPEPSKESGSTKNSQPDGAGRTHAAATEQVASGVKRLGRASHAAPASSPAMTGTQNAVPAPPLNVPADIAQQNRTAAVPKADFQSYRSLSPSLPQQPLAVTAQPGDVTALPVHSRATPGTGALDSAGDRIPVQNTQAPIPGAPPRAFEVRRLIGPAAGEEQTFHTLATPEPVLGAGVTPTAHSPQNAGLLSTGSVTHRSPAATDPRAGATATFERMDNAAPARILESSSQKLSVGVRDAGLGWIEIRTHAVAGQVAATVATGTGEAHAAIAAELPDLRHDLLNQQVALHSLSAERFAASSGGGGSASHPSESDGSPARAFSSPSRGNSSEPGEADGESLSYISIRV